MHNDALSLALPVLLFLLAFPGMPAQAQVPAPIHQRIGDRIGPKERAYFGLFPEVKDFAYADFAATGADTVEARIFTHTNTESPDSTVPLLLSQVTALRDYFNTFEHYANPYSNSSWQEMNRASRLVDPNTPTPHVQTEWPTLQVVTEEARYDGVLLAATDTLLLLHPTEQPYSWQAPALHAFAPATIRHVTILEPERQSVTQLFYLVSTAGGLLLAQPLLFDFSEPGVRNGGVAALVGGGALGYGIAQALTADWSPTEGSYHTLLPSLQKHAVFRVVWPFDLSPAEAAQRGRSSPALAGQPAAPFQLRRWWAKYGLVSVAVVGGSAISGQAASPVYNELLRSRPVPLAAETGVRQDTPARSGLDAAIRPIPWLRLGLTWQERERTPVIYPDEFSALYEVVSEVAGAFRPYVEAILPSPAVGGFHFEAAAGVGVETHELKAFREQPSAFIDISNETSETLTNVFLQGSLELVAPKQVSFFVRLTSRSLPPLSVEPYGFDVSNFPSPFYQRDAYTVGFGYREVTWGTRFRF